MKKRRHIFTAAWFVPLCLGVSVCIALSAGPAEPLFIAPLYPEYTLVSPEEFAHEVAELKRRLPESGGVHIGFSAFLNVEFRELDPSKPIGAAALKPTMDQLSLILSRARANKLPIHISISSGFFHGYNLLREAAIRKDVRNAQWFSDGWIADPQDLSSKSDIPRAAWITPSRYAQPLRQRMQESMTILGKQLAAAMKQNPETLLKISGDTEVELSFARNLDPNGSPRAGGRVVLADYSPFMIAEFRDWIRNKRYARDASPATDDDHDGHTFNNDFRQQFRTWQLRYFNESGPISYDEYRAMSDKLPKSGPYLIEGGFDAPRQTAPDNPLWKAWQEFRVRVIANYQHDFAEWITADSRIPASRYFTHQIPAEYLFEGKDHARLETSASPLETAFIPGVGSPGVTVFDVFDGRSYSRTSNPAMFKRLQEAGAWSIVEYNPSVPSVADESHYMNSLMTLYSFRPSMIVPFAWTNEDQHNPYRIQNTAYETALRKFVQEAGSVIHR